MARITYKRPYILEQTQEMINWAKRQSGVSQVQLLNDALVFFTTNFEQAMKQKFDLANNKPEINKFQETDDRQKRAEFKPEYFDYDALGLKDPSEDEMQKPEEMATVQLVDEISSATVSEPTEATKPRKPFKRENRVEEINKAAEVFKYYCEVFGKSSTYKFRPQKIMIRLKENTVEELKACIDACKASRFHNGENNQNKKYNSLYDNILAPSKIDRWLSEIDDIQTAAHAEKAKKDKEEAFKQAQIRKQEIIRKYSLTTNPYGEIIDSTGEKLYFSDYGDLDPGEMRRLEKLAAKQENKKISEERYKFKRNLSSPSSASSTVSSATPVPHYQQINKQLDVPDQELFRKNRKANFDKYKLQINPIGLIVDSDGDSVEFLSDGNLCPEQEQKLQKLLQKQSSKVKPFKNDLPKKEIIVSVKTANPQDLFGNMVSTLTGKMSL